MQYKITTADPEIYGEDMISLYTYPETCSDHPEDWTVTVLPTKGVFSLLEGVLAIHKKDEEYYDKVDKSLSSKD